ncbi:MAG: WbuC family cupin fold metalloprotein [Planctomycetota bacterium]
MTRDIYHNEDAVFAAGEEWLGRLRTAADTSPRQRARLCLHRSPDDAVQEMIICFRRDSAVPVHRHQHRTESFHVLEGKLTVFTFDDSGAVQQTIALGGRDSGRPFLFRMSTPEWHTVRIESEYAIVHEITVGPFRDGGLEVPPWCPTEEPLLREWLQSLP